MSTKPELAGIGLRAPYFQELLEDTCRLGFLEAHSENYFGSSPSRDRLLELSQQYPLSLHGVGLSLGRADGLDTRHLEQLRSLVDDINPVLVSEHLAWSGYQHRQVPDLLPVPYVRESLKIFIDHVNTMQDVLGRQILVENPANYLVFRASGIHEADFLNQLASATGCRILLDINNLYVSSINVGVNPADYLQRLDATLVGQYHLAGHLRETGVEDSLLIDSHNQPVANPVWDLYRDCLIRLGHKPTLIEWDSDFPPLEQLLAEANTANRVADSVREASRVAV